MKSHLVSFLSTVVVPSLILLVAPPIWAAAADDAKKQETTRPHSVRIHFNSGRSVDQKSEVFANIAKQLKGAKKVDTNGRFWDIRIPKGMSVRKAIEVAESVMGVVRASAIEINPDGYRPGMAFILFDDAVNADQRKKVVSSLKGASIRHLGFDSTAVVNLPKGTSVFDAMRAYTYQPGVKRVEPIERGFERR